MNDEADQVRMMLENNANLFNLRTINSIFLLSFPLHSQDVMGKSDPFLEFYKSGATADEWHKVHTTEVSQNH